MPQPFYSVNPQDWGALPGLYIAEQNPPATVLGVGLNTVGMAGESIRGPVGKPILCSTEKRFSSVYGGRDQTANGTGGAYLNKMRQSLMNKPFGPFWAIRAAAASATAARADLLQGGSAVLRVAAATPGSWGSNITLDVVAASDGDSTHFNLKATYLGQTVTFINVNINGASDNTLSVVGTDDANLVVLTKLANGRPDNVAAAVMTGGGDGLAADPLAPTVTPHGTAGSTGYSYEVVGVADSGALSNHSAAGSTSTGNATLNGSNYNIITFAPTPGYSTYKLYRTASAGTPASTGLIATLSAGIASGGLITFNDTGLAGDSTLPSTSNTTAAIADTDFTGTGKVMEGLAGKKGVAIAFVAERSSSNIRSKWLTLAGSASDRMFVMCADDETVTASTAETDAASYRSDRLIYAFNHTYTIDPDTAAEQLTDPSSWMASTLSQNDVDVDPISEDAKAELVGIERLYNDTYQRGDYVALKAAGISALEEDDGFHWSEGVSTYLPDGTGKERITRRRSADALILDMSGFLSPNVGAKLTLERTLSIKGTLTAYLRKLQKQERIVDDFSIDIDKVNDPDDEAMGIYKVQVSVKLINHILSLVLIPQIGTTVQITQVQ